jgi:hypothetical protein
LAAARFYIRLGLALAAFAVLAGGCGGRSEREAPSANAAQGGTDASGGTGSAKTAAGATGAETAAGAGGSDAGAPFDRLCDEYRYDICTLYLTCTTEIFHDRADCMKLVDCYGVDALLRARANGHVLVDTDALLECLAAFEARPCAVPGRTFLTIEPDIFQFLGTCPHAVIPQQKLGDACDTDAECETRYHCVTESCPGVCEPRFELGDACTVEHEQCSLPYGACLDGTCRIPVDFGQTCADDLDCQRDLLCDPVSQRCVEPPSRPGLGEPCINDFNGTKPALLCQDGLTCDDGGNIDAGGTCANLGAEGTPCTWDSCQYGLYCMWFGGQQVCHARSTEGAVCDPSSVGCEPGLFCQSTPNDPNVSTCIPQLALGESCNEDGQCGPDLVCSYGVCVKAAYPGDPCDPQAPQVCQHSNCNGEGLCVPLGHVGDPCFLPGDCALLDCANGVCTDATTCVPTSN